MHAKKFPMIKEGTCQNNFHTVNVRQILRKDHNVTAARKPFLKPNKHYFERMLNSNYTVVIHAHPTEANQGERCC